ncbi:MAG: hypothetical protein P4M05_31040 [Bradyrhizobium sp.]|nr:hypothetical protein [Bradyrhizobium sp.]
MTAITITAHKKIKLHKLCVWASEWSAPLMPHAIKSKERMTLCLFIAQRCEQVINKSFRGSFFGAGAPASFCFHRSLDRQTRSLRLYENCFRRTLKVIYEGFQRVRF